MCHLDIENHLRAQSLAHYRRLLQILITNRIFIYRKPVSKNL